MHILTCRPADNLVQPGIDRLKMLLDIRDGVPGMFIASNCENLRNAMLQYHWNERSQFGILRPNHEASDLCDALRYMIYSAGFVRGIPGRIVESQSNQSLLGICSPPCPDFNNPNWRPWYSWESEEDDIEEEIKRRMIPPG